MSGQIGVGRRAAQAARAIRKIQGHCSSARSMSQYQSTRSTCCIRGFTGYDGPEMHNERRTTEMKNDQSARSVQPSRGRSHRLVEAHLIDTACRTEPRVRYSKERKVAPATRHCLGVACGGKWPIFWLVLVCALVVGFPALGTPQPAQKPSNVAVAPDIQHSVFSSTALHSQVLFRSPAVKSGTRQSTAGHT